MFVIRIQWDFSDFVVWQRVFSTVWNFHCQQWARKRWLTSSHTNIFLVVTSTLFADFFFSNKKIFFLKVICEQSGKLQNIFESIIWEKSIDNLAVIVLSVNEHLVWPFPSIQSEWTTVFGSESWDSKVVRSWPTGQIKSKQVEKVNLFFWFFKFTFYFKFLFLKWTSWASKTSFEK